MSTIKHILVATDFSEPSEAALAMALDLGRRFEARVTLLPAWAIPMVAYAEGVSWPLFDLQESAKKALDDLLATTAKTYPNVDAVLREGTDWQQIIDTAKERGCDLVVMGTHGRRGIPRVVLGSVAEKVVRLSPVPVVTVGPPQSADTSANKGLARILVPTDFSEPSEHALAFAVDLARAYGSQLTLLHVWTMPNTGYAETLDWPVVPLERAAQKALDEALARTRRLHAKTDGVLRRGAEAPQIVDFIEQHGVDAVVLGTHGRRGLARLVVGSVTQKVVRLSPVPVFTVGGRGAERGAER
jgi:nucleotide-binding universal stress UspA family protein